jgi:hypothetical protein
VQEVKDGEEKLEEEKLNLMEKKGSAAWMMRRKEFQRLPAVGLTTLV